MVNGDINAGYVESYQPLFVSSSPQTDIVDSRHTQGLKLSADQRLHFTHHTFVCRYWYMYLSQLILLIYM